MAEQADVVTTETIEVEWGNAIRDRTVQRYDDLATRSAENTSPTAGDLAFMQDTGDLDIYFSGAWRHIGDAAGIVKLNAGATAPPGWLVCNGAAVSRTTYAGLFAAIGTTWGVGDGSTTFNVPDLRGRVPRGVAASGTGNTLGGTFGADTHTHTGPSHTHTGPSHTHSVSGTSGSGGTHSHTLESGFAKWGHSASVNYYRFVSTEDWSLNRTNDPNGPLMPTAGSGTVSNGTELGGDTGSGGSHTHSFSATSGAGGTGATGASGTGATGSGSTIPAAAALHFVIKT